MPHLVLADINHDRLLSVINFDIQTIETGYGHTEIFYSEDRRFLFRIWEPLTPSRVYTGTIDMSRRLGAHLAGYSISDVQNPRLIFDINLGSNEHLYMEKDTHPFTTLFKNHLFVTVEHEAGDSPNHWIKDTLVFDISDPVHLKELRRFEGADFEVVKNTSPNEDIVHDLASGRYYNITDLSHPVEVPSDRIAPEPNDQPHTHRSLEEGGTDAFDIFGDRAVTGTYDGHCTLWDKSKAGRYVALREFEPSTRTCLVTLLPDPNVFIVHDRYQMRFIAFDPSPVTAKRIRDVYSGALSRYEEGRNITEAYYAFAIEPIADMQDVGIDALLEQKVDGLSEEESGHVLADYGLWLTQIPQRNETDYALRVLRRAVQLAPRFVDAWARLAAVDTIALPLAETSEEKALLWQEKSMALRQQAKDQTPPAADTAYDLASSLSQSKTVCDYVSDAFAHDEGAAILASHGYLTFRDMTIQFSASQKFYDSGSSAEFFLWFVPSDGSHQTLSPETLQDIEALPGFTFYDPQHGSAQAMSVVPYRDASYLLVMNGDHKPFQLYEPSNGLVCTF